MPHSLISLPGKVCVWVGGGIPLEYWEEPRRNSEFKHGGLQGVSHLSQALVSFSAPSTV